jgi:hypothetical protein
MFVRARPWDGRFMPVSARNTVAAGAHSRLTIRRIDAIEDFAKRVP